MIVIEKKREIAILKAMGATDGTVLGIFMLQGVVVGVIGTLAGVLVGGGLVLYLDKIHFPLDPKVYLIDHLPVVLNPDCLPRHHWNRPPDLHRLHDRTVLVGRSNAPRRRPALRVRERGLVPSVGHAALVRFFLRAMTGLAWSIARCPRCSPPVVGSPGSTSSIEGQPRLRERHPRHGSHPRRPRVRGNGSELRAPRPTQLRRPPPHAPLVLNFHGLTQTGNAQRSQSHMDDKADQEGYIVAYPNGIDNAWNSGPKSKPTKSDDVGFTRAVIDDLGTAGLHRPQARLRNRHVQRRGHVPPACVRGSRRHRRSRALLPVNSRSPPAHARRNDPSR